MFSIYGGKTEFNQWDLGQLVTNPCMKEGDAVVFKACGKAYETNAFTMNGEVVADVPNFLLQAPCNITVDLGWGLDVHMECRTVFNVVAKEKPTDYCCEYNIKYRSTNSDGMGGVSSWDDLPAPMPASHLPEGVPYAENGVLLEETDAVENTYPNFGKVWEITNAPIMLTVGEACTVIYNGVSYDCVCNPVAIPGMTTALDTVGIGNFSVLGGEDTGEPFAMLVTPSMQGISAIDLSGATSVKIGIMGKVGHKMDDRCLSDTARVLVVKFEEREDGSLVSLSHTYQQMISALVECVPVVGIVQYSDGSGASTALVGGYIGDSWVMGSHTETITDSATGDSKTYCKESWYRAAEYSKYYLDGDMSNKTIGNELWEKCGTV